MKPWDYIKIGIAAIIIFIALAYYIISIFSLRKLNSSIKSLEKDTDVNIFMRKNIIDLYIKQLRDEHSSIDVDQLDSLQTDIIAGNVKSLSMSAKSEILSKMTLAFKSLKEIHLYVGFDKGMQELDTDYKNLVVKYNDLVDILNSLVKFYPTGYIAKMLKISKRDKIV